MISTVREAESLTDFFCDGSRPRTRSRLFPIGSVILLFAIGFFTANRIGWLSDPRSWLTWGTEESGPPDSAPALDAEQFVRQFLASEGGSSARDFANLFGEQTEYFSEQDANRDFIARDKERYFKRWPFRRYVLDGKIQMNWTGDYVSLEFPVRFNVSREGKHATGLVQRSLTVHYEDDHWKVVRIKDN